MDLKRMVLIDGDVLCYHCGFAVEHNLHKVYVNGMEEHGSVASFRYKKDLFEFMKDQEDLMSVVVEQELEPLSFCLYTVKRYIQRVLNETEADDYLICLSPSKNFRHKIATILPYKGNRTSAKPTYIGEIKSYITDKYKTELAVNIEADDLISIRARECSRTADWLPVTASIDKDLKQIPGDHYNTKTGEMSYVMPEEGTKLFYQQCLSGDTTDNIQGIPGMGPGKAKKFLEGKDTEKEMWEVVIEQYTIYERKVDNSIKAEDRAIENARLVYIMHEFDELWEPPQL
mgnify:CR=1 FL=1